MTKLLMVALLAAVPIGRDCDEARDFAIEAYGHARRAYRASNLHEVQSYARRAMNSASEAESAASSCNCDDAEFYANDAYTYARRAYRADDVETARSYAKKAMNSATDAEAAAEDCQ